MPKEVDMTNKFSKKGIEENMKALVFKKTLH